MRKPERKPERNNEKKKTFDRVRFVGSCQRRLLLVEKLMAKKELADGVFAHNEV
ncbi:MAG TPA: hypothetical protein PKX93_10985 [bacterium]|nr:hypothetical protein [bacterium]HPP11434.1 hypothetical protein [bacterium]